MLVGDLFVNLSYGELSNLSIGNDGDGAIKDEAQPKLVRYANHALKMLNSRFPHNRDYVKIRLSADRQKYPLTKAYTVSAAQGDAADRFIIDNAEDPYEGNLLKVVGVQVPDDEDTEEDETEDMQFNTRSATCSVETLSYNTLYFREPVDGQELIVEIQLAHLNLTLPVDLGEEINISPILEEALELKVAARVYSTMNGEENAAKAARLNMEYEQLCQIVEQQDLMQLSETETTSKLSDKGFF